MGPRETDGQESGKDTGRWEQGRREGPEGSPTSSEGRGPGRPPGGGDSREAILEAAAELFLRDGLNASTRDIAAGAGVTQAALYHYFPTKQDLLREAAKGASQIFERVGAHAVPDGEPEEVFRRMAEDYLGVFAIGGAARFLATMLVEGMKMPGFLEDMGQRLEGGIVGPAIGYLELLRKQGRVGADVDPPVVGQMLFGTLFSFVIARNVLGAPWVQDLDPSEVAKQVAHILVHGIAGSAGAAADAGVGARPEEQKGDDDAVA